MPLYSWLRSCNRRLCSPSCLWKRVLEASFAERSSKCKIHLIWAFKAESIIKRFRSWKTSYLSFEGWSYSEERQSHEKPSPWWRRPRQPSTTVFRKLPTACGTAVSKLDYCQTYQQMLSEVRISCLSPKGQAWEEKAKENSVLCHRRHNHPEMNPNALPLQRLLSVRCISISDFVLFRNQKSKMLLHICPLRIQNLSL